MTDRPRIILEGKSLGEYFEQAVENKKLKDKLYAKEKECDELKKAEEYDSRYNDMQAEIDCGNAIVEKYEKCLIEIKEIIEQGVKIHDDIIVSKQILQKISEVLDGNT